ncbi:MAG: hypothetical protein R3264_06005, partial [Anaerolineae bacterium]|nr:hypothetical protein [Anaerolineae bacterium]
IRVTVRENWGLPVNITAVESGWSLVNSVGTKPEYGPDVLEFAPLQPGRYLIEPQGLGISYLVEVEGGQVAQIIFEPGP